MNFDLDTPNILEYTAASGGYTNYPAFINSVPSYHINPIVTLQTESIIDHDKLIHISPNELDIYIKKELAQKIAEQLVNEDLIKIETAYDTNVNIQKVRATVKVVQE